MVMEPHMRLRSHRHDRAVDHLNNEAKHGRKRVIILAGLIALVYAITQMIN